MCNCKKETPNPDGPAGHPFEHLVTSEFLLTADPEFSRLVKYLPDTHWSKYDVSAARLGWEAHKAWVRHKDSTPPRQP